MYTFVYIYCRLQYFIHIAQLIVALALSALAFGTSSDRAYHWARNENLSSRFECLLPKEKEKK